MPCFRLSASGVRDDTQIHTHMCYADFNDIIEAISDLDADVISIENSRSDAELLEVFRDFRTTRRSAPASTTSTPRACRPSEEMTAAPAPGQRPSSTRDLVWVNPDCGLKTRRYEETVPALEHMVSAARSMRGAAVPA